MDKEGCKFEEEKKASIRIYKVKKLEMRSIPRKEFKRYLEKIGENCSSGCYCGEGWRVVLSEEYKVPFGKFSMIACDVTMTVEEEMFDAFLLTFRKNFMRGGG
ncbi:MAG: hypothetical protein ACRCU3_06810 [Eubacteriaceae bacterium]